MEVDLDLDLDLAALLQTYISKSVNQSHGIRNTTEKRVWMEKKFSKIDTIGDAYIMVAWLNEGSDPYDPKVKHAPKLKHAPN